MGGCFWIRELDPAGMVSLADNRVCFGEINETLHLAGGGVCRWPLFLMLRSSM